MRSFSSLCYILSRILCSVTKDGFWIDDRVYWTLWYTAWTHFAVHAYTHTHTSVHIYVFTSRSLVSASNGSIPFLWVLELSPASPTGFSQQQLTKTEQFSDTLTNCNS
jgi:hypothetical protein